MKPETRIKRAQESKLEMIRFVKHWGHPYSFNSKFQDEMYSYKAAVHFLEEAKIDAARKIKYWEKQVVKLGKREGKL